MIKNSKVKKAFTLVEIMAATAIMSIIVLSVLGVARTILVTWNRASGQLQSMFEAGVVGGIIQEDMESMKLKRDGKVWLQVAYPYTVGFLSGESYIDSTPLRPPEVMFYAPTALRPRYTQAEMRSANSGDGTSAIMIPGSMCAIKYQLSLKNPFMKGTGTPGDESQYNAFYSLYRAVIDPKNTILEGSGVAIQGFALSDEDFESYRYALQTNLWDKNCTITDENGLEQQGQNLREWAVAPENLIAMNMIDFRITVGVLYPNPNAGGYNEPDYEVAYIPPGMPFTVGRQIITDSAYRYSSSGERETVPGILIRDGKVSFIDVSMTIISDTGAKEIKAMVNQNMMDAEGFKRMVLEHGTTISRRVQILSESE